MVESWRERLGSRLPLVLVLLPVVWILHPLLLFNDFYVSEDTDTLQIQYPIHHLLGISMQEGQVPLWTHLLSNGFPMLAEGEAGVMYPLNLFYFRYLSPYNAYQLALVVAVLLSALTAYHYLRGREHSTYAAALGAISFAVGGYALGHLRHLNHLQAMSMLPLALLFGERYLGERRISDGMLAGAALALTVLAGMPQLAFFTALALILLALVACWEPPQVGAMIGLSLRWLDRPWLWRLQGFALLPLAGGVAALLAAPQVMLTWELIPHTERAGGLPTAAASEDALTLETLLHFVSPHAHGLPVAGDYSLPGRYWETLGYVGLLPLVLCLFAPFLLWRRERRVIFPLVLIGVGLTMAFGEGSPIYRLAWEVLPGMQWFRVPGRFVLFVNLGLAMLAALGLDFLLERLVGHPHALGRRFAEVLPVLALGVTGVDLGYHGDAMLAWMKRDTLLSAPPSVSAIPRLGPYRVLSLPGGGIRVGPDGKQMPLDLRLDPDPFLPRRALLWRNYNIVHGVPTVGAYLGLTFAAHRNLEARLLSHIRPTGTGELEVPTAATHLMSFLGVRVVLTYFGLASQALVKLDEVQVPGVEPSVKIYGLDDAHPRAYLARTLRPCTDETALARLEQGHFGAGWSPCEHAAQDSTEPDVSSGVAGVLEPVARGETVLAFEVNLLRGGYLVLRESWAPGWKALVDGDAAEILPVDLIHRAVKVPPGKHGVRLEYQPRGMRRGLGLNLLGVLSVGLALILSRLPRRRPELEEETSSADGEERPAPPRRRPPGSPDLH